MKHARKKVRKKERKNERKKERQTDRLTERLSMGSRLKVATCLLTALKKLRPRRTPSKSGVLARSTNSTPKVEKLRSNGWTRLR